MSAEAVVAVTELYAPEFFVGRSETVTRSAMVVVPIVRDLLAPQSVLDLGCGQGEWLDAFGLEDARGIDIAAPFQHMRRDLTDPLYLGRTFDLVVCLEVAEHLPVEAADTLVDTIVRHGRTVMFSAAVPGQEGKGHVNCQPHEYWHEKFRERGYAVNDSIRHLIGEAHAVSPWYRNNIFLYIRDS